MEQTTTKRLSLSFEEFDKDLATNFLAGYKACMNNVKQVMDTISEVLGKNINYEVVDRRLGDPAQTIADVSKAKSDLNWEAKNDLKSMVSSAWQAWQNMPAKT
jgi:UDP-glucose 4-epimerase